MTDVYPIRLRDAVDTAQQFAAEIDQSHRFCRECGRSRLVAIIDERGVCRYCRLGLPVPKLFGRSRFRRAKWMDAAAVALLMALMMCLGVITFATTAKADGRLSDDELVYVELFGGTAVCPVITEYYGLSGVMGVHEAIMDAGFSADDAIDIINASVHEYCPDNWPLLVAIGKRFRSGIA